MSASSQQPARAPTGNQAGRTAVDGYLAALDPPHRENLEALRQTIRSILPHAEEGLKYGMPAFSVAGKGVAGYAAFKNHCGYFPMSGSVLERAADEVADYETSKGGLRFGIQEHLPLELVRRLIELRIEEISTGVE